MFTSWSFSPQNGLGGSGSWPFFPAFFPDCLLPLLYQPVSLILRPRQVRFSRTDTCPISPYPKQLGVVVKAEEHGSVRCRVFNGSNGSFPFVLSRHTVQRSFLYQHRYFRFFPKLFLCRSCPFFQEGLGDAKERIILGYVSRLFGILLYVLGYIPLWLGHWAPM